MRTKIQIDLPPIPYEHEISELIAYLQMVASETTGTKVQLILNDIDYTDKISVFKQMRKPSIYNR